MNYFDVLDTTMPTTIDFYIVAGEDRDARFVSPKVTLNVICVENSTTFTNPTLLANKEFKDYFEMINPLTIYTIANFILTNNNCPITELSIEPVLGGTIDDYTSTDGKTLVNIST